MWRRFPDEEQGRWRSRLPLEQDSGNAAEGDASLDAFMLLARRLHGLEQGLEAPPLLEARSLLRREITRLLADEHRPEPGDLTSPVEADAEALQEYAAWLDAQDQLQPQDIAANPQASSSPYGDPPLRPIAVCRTTAGVSGIIRPDSEFVELHRRRPCHRTGRSSMSMSRRRSLRVARKPKWC